jgi:hypothetical protein
MMPLSIKTLSITIVITKAFSKMKDSIMALSIAIITITLRIWILYTITLIKVKLSITTLGIMALSRTRRN